MNNQKLLFVIAILLISVFTIMMINDDESLGDKINEGVEEVGDEIDDAVS